MMRNDYSNYTLVEMLRSYAEGTEEGTLGGNQRLDAADHIEELTSCLREAVDLMEDVMTGAYKPDSFTTQPWRTALTQEVGDEG